MPWTITVEKHRKLPSLRAFTARNVTLGGSAHDRFVFAAHHAPAQHILDIVATAKSVGLDHRHDDRVFLTCGTAKMRSTDRPLLFGKANVLAWEKRKRAE
eukprot:scaffold1194_cov127-Cylindrotheca_fusiformis.AAC.28